MNDSLLMQVGIGGILAVLVLREVFAFLKQRGNSGLNWQKLARQIDEMWKLHDKRDDDGVPVWYVRRSLEQAVKDLAENIQKQTEVLSKMGEWQREMQRAMAQLLETMRHTERKGMTK